MTSNLTNRRSAGYRVRQLGIVATFLMITVAAAAEERPVDKAKDEYRGVTFYESFQGSSNTLGQVYKLDTTVGYNFNKYFGIDGGIPFYFVRPSDTSASSGFTTGSGIGNAYLDLRLTVNNPILNYATTLTGTAPTGDKDRGFSTGRSTYDWNNHFDRPIFGLTPFANIGIANAVSDTHFFTRPFTSLGTVTHLEGGATLKILPMIRVGASVYDIIPSGEQKVFSKLITRRMTGAVAPGATSRRGRGGVFERAHETVGGPDLVRDNGASAWIAARVGRFADLEIGYTRSVDFDLNTVTFGIGFNVAYLARKARGH